MFQFSDPIYFVLLIPVIVLGWRMRGRRSGESIRFASFSDMPERRLTWRIMVANMTPVAFLAALTLIVVALARPQFRLATEFRRTDAVAMEMVLDISGSMAKPGMASGKQGESGEEPVTRLDIVTSCFATFVEQRPDDLIGLITFGGYAVTKAPLTTDHEALLHLLADIEVPGRSSAGGAVVVSKDELLTAIGDALAVACARLKEADVKSKVIILLTDGGSNAGLVDPGTAAGIAARLGIHVYTIGVGATGGLTPSVEETFADVALLKKIAGDTGGLYYDASSREDLTRVLDSINELEKTEVETFAYSQRRELFHFFLIPALCLVLLTVTSSIVIRRRMI